VKQVVYFHEFAAGGGKLERPAYLLFGRSDEAFLTHLASAPPDFQQVLRVEFTGDDMPDILPDQLDALLAEGLFLELTDRDNAVAARLRPDETLLCSADAAAGLPIGSAGVRVVEEIYCEEGELSDLVTDAFNDARRCGP
jgi:hypothetical protein